jgi:hypothetical protein
MCLYLKAFSSIHFYLHLSENKMSQCCSVYKSLIIKLLNSCIQHGIIQAGQIETVREVIVFIAVGVGPKVGVISAR